MGWNGWQETLADLAFLEHRMTQAYDRPAILFGHSMGAMLAQEYAYTLGHRLHAMILSGSHSVFPKIPALLLSALARFDSWRLTPASPSPLISKNLFATTTENLSVRDGDGGFAWLSRDKERSPTIALTVLRSYAERWGCGHVYISSAKLVAAQSTRHQQEFTHLPLCGQ